MYEKNYYVGASAVKGGYRSGAAVYHFDGTDAISARLKKLRDDLGIIHITDEEIEAITAYFSNRLKKILGWSIFGRPASVDARMNKYAFSLPFTKDEIEDEDNVAGGLYSLLENWAGEYITPLSVKAWEIIKGAEMPHPFKKNARSISTASGSNEGTTDASRNVTFSAGYPTSTGGLNDGETTSDATSVFTTQDAENETIDDSGSPTAYDPAAFVAAFGNKTAFWIDNLVRSFLVLFVSVEDLGENDVVFNFLF